MGLPTKGWMVAALGVVLSACASSPPSTFYTLTGPMSAGATPPPGIPLFIEMLPVSVSERLSRPQMVLRTDASQLTILEQDRWASPFNFELRDALAAGIVARSGAADVTKGGRPPNTNTYRVAVDLQQYDAIVGKEVRSVFGWTIASADGSSNAVCKMVVNEPVTQAGVEGVVESMQRVVKRVSATIADNVTALNSHHKVVCPAG